MKRRAPAGRAAWPGVLLAVSGLALHIPASGRAQTPESLPRVTGSVELALVNVDVVVTGKNGVPVKGLGPSDFTVLHGGRPVAITNFREEKRRTALPAPTPGPAEPTTPTPGPAPTSEQAPANADGGRRHVVFFIDDLALPDPRERGVLFDALKSIVARSLRPGDDAMIVTWRRGIRRVFPFTGDIDLLGRQLDVVSRDAGRLGTQTQTEIESLEAADEFYAWVGEGGDSTLARNLRIQERWVEVRAKLTALRGLVATMAGMEGRKALVLVSRRLSKSAGEEYEYSTQARGRQGLPGSSVPVAGIDTKRFLDAVAETANAAGVTIHSIYAEAWSAEFPSVTRRSAPGTLDRFSALTPAQRSWLNEMSTLGPLSERTGGVAAGSILQAPLFADRVATDLTNWYSIGYPKPAGSGRADTISVRVKGSGLVVRSRRSYVERPAEELTRERVLASLFRKDEAARLPIAVQSGPSVRKKKGLYVTPVLVRVPVRSLALVPDGPDVRGAISVYSVSAGPDGEASDVSRERHEVRVPADSAGEASVVVLGFELAVETSSAAARISICVRDETSGDAGFRLIRPGR